ncbi:hypothetical protein FHX74_001797 [Friedmanniella endophytica]|uniref:Peptidase M14 domain-containing protein n=1 Tax=Microlunatus kandeliicorticis TaxID=1759536 RepID=A0A7W3IS19_9ACTN|nr:M14 family zinc carboxypeptidase [Microlunatus kandeliicorticis]MBA8794192.1 hypothetical protein [Microlunatus kandeliicorticis]
MTTGEVVTSSTLGPNEIVRRAGAVRPIGSFWSVDELADRFDRLAEQHPGRVSRRRIGTSRLGEPIHVYTVDGREVAGQAGSADREHLLVGGVHPNEPIGFHTAHELASTVLTDQALRRAVPARWHVVPCVDPDGARMNERWYADPSDRNFYARWFYRPAPDEQVEWSFPTDYRDAYFDAMMPEALALMRLIDAVRPDLYVSLHNGEFGGVYYYLSRRVPSLTETLHAVPASLGLPLDVGEPESPYLQTYAPAIFGTGTIADAYDYLDRLGLDAAAQISGSSSGEYAAQRHGTLGLVAELPLWSHPAADDLTVTDESYAELVRRTATDLRALGDRLQHTLDAAEPLLGIESPFRRASRVFVPMLGELAGMDLARADLEEAQRPATVAERFGREDLVRCFGLRHGGMLLRALDVEAEAGTAPVTVRRLRGELGADYARWQAAAAADVSDAWLVPIERLVGVQLGAVLAAAAHLAASA